MDGERKNKLRRFLENSRTFFMSLVVHMIICFQSVSALSYMEVCNRTLVAFLEAIVLNARPAGIGTTTTALRHGVPPIFVPVARNQFYWADLCFHNAWSPAELDLDASIAQIRDAIMVATEADTRERVREISEEIQHENGVGLGVKWIENALQQPPPLLHGNKHVTLPRWWMRGLVWGGTVAATAALMYKYQDSKLVTNLMQGARLVASLRPWRLLASKITID
jgi:hypothetical protein